MSLGEGDKTVDAENAEEHRINTDPWQRLAEHSNYYNNQDEADEIFESIIFEEESEGIYDTDYDSYYEDDIFWWPEDV